MDRSELVVWLSISAFCCAKLVSRSVASTIDAQILDISGPRLTILSKACSSTIMVLSLCSQSIKLFSTINRGVSNASSSCSSNIQRLFDRPQFQSNVSPAEATGIFLSVNEESSG